MTRPPSASRRRSTSSSPSGHLTRCRMPKQKIRSKTSSRLSRSDASSRRYSTLERSSSAIARKPSPPSSSTPQRARTPLPVDAVKADTHTGFQVSREGVPPFRVVLRPRSASSDEVEPPPTRPRGCRYYLGAAAASRTAPAQANEQAAPRHLRDLRGHLPSRPAGLGAHPEGAERRIERGLRAGQ